MGSQSIQESGETLLARRGLVSTLCLSVMLVGAFSLSLMASPANAGDRKKDDKDRNHSLVMHPYSDHSLRNMVRQLQLEIENLKQQMASKPGTSPGTGPSLTDFESLKTRVTSVETTQGSYSTRLHNVESHPVLALKDYVKIETTVLNGMAGPHIIFTGANVHVRNGANATNTTNSLGNLVLGYNEALQGSPRNGSHNLVGGEMNSFESYGGLVFGTHNKLSGGHAAILGGGQNNATGLYSTVIGGQQNTSTVNYEIKPLQQSTGGSTGGGYAGF